MDALFDALGDATRRRILDALHARDGQTLTELRAQVGASRQVISHHLDVLETVGLVSTRRQGRYRLTFIDTAPLVMIAGRWPARGQAAPSGGVRTALDLLELGAKLRAQRHRREQPLATDDDVQRVVDAWLMDRRRAPLGDGEGRPVPWSRPG